MKQIVILVSMALLFNTVGARYHKNAPKTEPQKTVVINGPLIAPTDKGTLCVRYRYQGEKVKTCQTIAAGKTYTFSMPARINKITVTRFSEKSCKTKHNKQVCKTLKARFDVPRDNKLSLKYEHNVIRKAPIEPQIHGYEPRGDLGWPTWSVMDQPSILYDRIYNGDATRIY